MFIAWLPFLYRARALPVDLLPNLGANGRRVP
jgi:hypothetical protein